MELYLLKEKWMIASIPSFSIEKIPNEHNVMIDAYKN